MANTKQCHECFQLLSDSTRLRIVRKLQSGMVNVSGLTKAVGVTQPTVSHHLKLLESCGFIVKEKRGRETYYIFNKQYPCKACGVFRASKLYV